MNDLAIFEAKPSPARAMWYTLDQNNSGGSWVRNDDVDYYVSIEAYSEQQAMDIFDSLDSGAEYWCECCGERWYWSPEVADEPTYYGKRLLESIDPTQWSKPAVVMHGLNGRKARFNGKEFKEIV